MQNGKGLEGASRLDRVTMTTDFFRTEPTPHPRSFFFFLLVSERDGGIFTSGGDRVLTLGRRQKKSPVWSHSCKGDNCEGPGVLCLR